jgi:hypothetical protein
MENGSRRGFGEIRHDEKSNASVITDATTAKVVFTAQTCMRIKVYTDNKEERPKLGCIKYARLISFPLPLRQCEGYKPEHLGVRENN